MPLMNLRYFKLNSWTRARVISFLVFVSLFLVEVCVDKVKSEAALLLRALQVYVPRVQFNFVKSIFRGWAN